MLLMTTAVVLEGFEEAEESRRWSRSAPSHTYSRPPRTFGLPTPHVFRLHVHKSKQRVALHVHLFAFIT